MPIPWPSVVKPAESFQDRTSKSIISLGDCLSPRVVTLTLQKSRRPEIRGVQG